MTIRPPPRPRSFPPSSTNLEERVHLDDLSKTIHTLFSTYGNILEVVVKGSIGRKGQAFVVFDNLDSATRALEEAQGFSLWDKPMVLEFAKVQSDALVKLNGDETDLETHKRSRLAEKERKQAIEANTSTNLKRPAPAAFEVKGSKVRGSGLKPTAGAAAVIPDEYLPPNKILFVQNLPDDYDVEALSGVFGRFEGFREVRLVPGRKGIAFVEYETEQGAIGAKERMANVPLGDEAKLIKVTFQRQ